MEKILKFLKSKQFKELFRYIIVGGLATVVEWAVFWLLNKPLKLQYIIATAIAFIFSTFANWGFGRLLVFKEPAGQSVFKEIASIYVASIAGFLFNIAIMFVLVQWVHLDEMISKIIATAIVFAYNFLVRKLLIYKKK